LISLQGYLVTDRIKCRNDGRRNLAEGLINERQLAAIEETAVLLDKQKREYEEAIEGGICERDIEAMRAVHKRDLKAAEMKEYDNDS
jgi:hypothetical protein